MDVSYKYKPGDKLVSRVAAGYLVIEVIAINPNDFKGMYSIKLTNGRIRAYNMDMVHRNCRLATETEIILYGK